MRVISLRRRRRRRDIRIIKTWKSTRKKVRKNFLVRRRTVGWRFHLKTTTIDEYCRARIIRERNTSTPARQPTYFLFQYTVSCCCFFSFWRFLFFIPVQLLVPNISARRIHYVGTSFGETLDERLFSSVPSFVVGRIDLPISFSRSCSISRYAQQQLLFSLTFTISFHRLIFFLALSFFFLGIKD